MSGSEPVTLFTDGACANNGRSDARASFAVVACGGMFGFGAAIRGSVAPSAYRFDEPASGRPAGISPIVPHNGTPPSNNRGELLGIVYALLAALRCGVTGPVEIVSDSEISVNTFLDWLPKRIKNGTEREMKNFDLIEIAWRLLCELRTVAETVEFTHVRSHRAAPPATAPARERALHKGNALADSHASAAPVAGVEVIGGPPALAALSA